MKVRDSQLQILSENHTYYGYLYCAFAAITALTSICCFSFYEVFVSKLSISQAFTVLVLINLVVSPLGEFVQSLYLSLECSHCMKRLGEIFLLEDNGGGEDGDDLGAMEEFGGLIEIKDASLMHIEGAVKRETDQREDTSGEGGVELGSLGATGCVLNGISMRVEPGSFSAIIGKVGSGKSSIILSILGELKLVKGSVDKIGSVAYISQEAFLMNDTVKNNILFGLDYHEVRYNTAVKISQLIPDLLVLPQGDETEIGERGITLSGGQKQRISIARAVYANADIYLIDDCLSALDAYVGRRVLEDVFLKELSSKTRLMVTHKLEVLDKVDYIYLVEGGKITEKGTLKEIKSKENYKKFSQATKKKKKISKSDGNITPPRLNYKPKIQFKTEQKPKSNPSNSNAKGSKKSKSNQSKSRISSSYNLKSIRHKDYMPRPRDEESSDIEQLRLLGLSSSSEGRNRLRLRNSNKITDYFDDQEELSFKHYLYYIKKGGISGFLLTLLSFLLVTILKLAAAWWISVWASGKYRLPLLHYIITCVTINLFYLLIKFIRASIVLNYSLNISKTIFSEATWSVLRRPSVYFDVNPIGKIFNLFTKEIHCLDWPLIQINVTFLDSFFTLFGAFIAGILISPPVLVVLVIGFIVIRSRLVQTTLTGNRLRRISLTLESRYLSKVSELLTGRVVVNAFGVRGKLIERFREVHDACINSLFQQHVVYVRLVNWMNLLVWAIITCSLACVMSTKLGLR